MKRKILNSKYIKRLTAGSFWKKMQEIPFLKKILTYEVISYVVVGALTTLVNYAVYFLARIFLTGDAGVIPSNVIAWIFAVAFAYIANKLFVFESLSREKNTVLKELAGFIACRIVSLFLDTGFVYVTVAVLHWNEPLFKLLSNVFVVIANYFASKYLIFKKKES